MATKNKADRWNERIQRSRRHRQWMARHADGSVSTGSSTTSSETQDSAASPPQKTPKLTMVVEDQRRKSQPVSPNQSMSSTDTPSTSKPESLSQRRQRLMSRRRKMASPQVNKVVMASRSVDKSDSSQGNAIASNTSMESDQSSLLTQERELQATEKPNNEPTNRIVELPKELRKKPEQPPVKDVQQPPARNFGNAYNAYEDYQEISSEGKLLETKEQKTSANSDQQAYTTLDTQPASEKTGTQERLPAPVPSWKRSIRRFRAKTKAAGTNTYVRTSEPEVASKTPKSNEDISTPIASPANDAQEPEEEKETPPWERVQPEEETREFLEEPVRIDTPQSLRLDDDEHTEDTDQPIEFDDDVHQEEEEEMEPEVEPEVVDEPEAEPEVIPPWKRKYTAKNTNGSSAISVFPDKDSVAPSDEGFSAGSGAGSGASSYGRGVRSFGTARALWSKNSAHPSHSVTEKDDETNVIETTYENPDVDSRSGNDEPSQETQDEVESLPETTHQHAKQTNTFTQNSKAFWQGKESELVQGSKSPWQKGAVNSWQRQSGAHRVSVPSIESEDDRLETYSEQSQSQVTTTSDNPNSPFAREPDDEQFDDVSAVDSVADSASGSAASWQKRADNKSVGVRAPWLNQDNQRAGSSRSWQSKSPDSTSWREVQPQETVGKQASWQDLMEEESMSAYPDPELDIVSSEGTEDPRIATAATSVISRYSGSGYLPTAYTSGKEGKSKPWTKTGRLTPIQNQGQSNTSGVSAGNSFSPWEKESPRGNENDRNLEATQFSLRPASPSVAKMWQQRQLLHTHSLSSEDDVSIEFPRDGRLEIASESARVQRNLARASSQTNTRSQSQVLASPPPGRRSAPWERAPQEDGASEDGVSMEASESEPGNLETTSSDVQKEGARMSFQSNTRSQPQTRTTPTSGRQLAPWEMPPQEDEPSEDSYSIEASEGEPGRLESPSKPEQAQRGGHGALFQPNARNQSQTRITPPPGRRLAPWERPSQGDEQSEDDVSAGASESELGTLSTTSESVDVQRDGAGASFQPDASNQSQTQTTPAPGHRLVPWERPSQGDEQSEGGVSTEVSEDEPGRLEIASESVGAQGRAAASFRGMRTQPQAQTALPPGRRLAPWERPPQEDEPPEDDVSMEFPQDEPGKLEIASGRGGASGSFQPNETQTLTAPPPGRRYAPWERSSQGGRPSEPKEPVTRTRVSGSGSWQASRSESPTPSQISDSVPTPPKSNLRLAPWEKPRQSIEEEGTSVYNKPVRAPSPVRSASPSFSQVLDGMSAPPKSNLRLAPWEKPKQKEIRPIRAPSPVRSASPTISQVSESPPVPPKSNLRLAPWEKRKKNEEEEEASAAVVSPQNKPSIRAPSSTRIEEPVQTQVPETPPLPPKSKLRLAPWEKTRQAEEETQEHSRPIRVSSTGRLSSWRKNREQKTSANLRTIDSPQIPSSANWTNPEVNTVSRTSSLTRHTQNRSRDNNSPDPREWPSEEPQEPAVTESPTPSKASWQRRSPSPFQKATIDNGSFRSPPTGRRLAPWERPKPSEPESSEEVSDVQPAGSSDCNNNDDTTTIRKWKKPVVSQKTPDEEPQTKENMPSEPVTDSRPVTTGRVPGRIQHPPWLKRSSEKMNDEFETPQPRRSPDLNLKKEDGVLSDKSIQNEEDVLSPGRQKDTTGQHKSGSTQSVSVANLRASFGSRRDASPAPAPALRVVTGRSLRDNPWMAGNRKATVARSPSPSPRRASPRRASPRSSPPSAERQGQLRSSSPANVGWPDDPAPSGTAPKAWGTRSQSQAPAGRSTNQKPSWVKQSPTNETESSEVQLQSQFDFPSPKEETRGQTWPEGSPTHGAGMGSPTQSDSITPPPQVVRSWRRKSPTQEAKNAFSESFAQFQVSSTEVQPEDNSWPASSPRANKSSPTSSRVEEGFATSNDKSKGVPWLRQSPPRVSKSNSGSPNSKTQHNSGSPQGQTKGRSWLRRSPGRGTKAAEPPREQTGDSNFTQKSPSPLRAGRAWLASKTKRYDKVDEAKAEVSSPPQSRAQDKLELTASMGQLYSDEGMPADDTQMVPTPTIASPSVARPLRSAAAVRQPSPAGGDSRKSLAAMAADTIVIADYNSTLDRQRESDDDETVSLLSAGYAGSTPAKADLPKEFQEIVDGPSVARSQNRPTPTSVSKSSGRSSWEPSPSLQDRLSGIPKLAPSRKDTFVYSQEEAQGTSESVDGASQVDGASAEKSSESEIPAASLSNIRDKHVGNEHPDGSEAGSSAIFGDPTTFGTAGGDNTTAPKVSDRAKAIEEWNGGRGSSIRNSGRFSSGSPRSSSSSLVRDAVAMFGQGRHSSPTKMGERKSVRFSDIATRIDPKDIRKVEYDDPPSVLQMDEHSDTSDISGVGPRFNVRSTVQRNNAPISWKVAQTHEPTPNTNGEVLSPERASTRASQVLKYWSRANESDRQVFENPQKWANQDPDLGALRADSPASEIPVTASDDLDMMHSWQESTPGSSPDRVGLQQTTEEEVPTPEHDDPFFQSGDSFFSAPEIPDTGPGVSGVFDPFFDEESIVFNENENSFFSATSIAEEDAKKSPDASPFRVILPPPRKASASRARRQQEASKEYFNRRTAASARRRRSASSNRSPQALYSGTNSSTMSEESLEI